MDVAVIIPLYNGERWIAQTLRSVLRQTRPPTEVVVVDDHSTDGSAAIVAEFPDVRLERNPEKGANLARRHGLALTTAPLVALLDQDDLWHPVHLASLSRWLDTHPACRAIAGTECDINRMVPRPAWNLTDSRVSTCHAWPHFPFGPRVGTPSAVVIRRTALDAMGGWPVDFPGVADYFAWLGLSANGTPHGGMARALAVTVARRRHASSYSASLRTPDSLLTYASTLVAASEEAARRFGAGSGIPGDTLERRVRLSRSLRDIVHAVSVADWEAFRRIATAAWQEAQAETPLVRAKLGAMVAWLLDGRRPQNELLTVLRQAREAWPEADSRTREILQRRHDSYAAMRPARTDAPPAPGFPS
jgi:glycosyltransferase involved in cell wall biosynthesis